MTSVLVGSNRYAKNQKLKEIVENFKSNHLTPSIESYHAEKLEKYNLINILTGPTLFSKDKLIIIDSLISSSTLVEEFIEVMPIIPPEIEVVLIEDSIDKRRSTTKAIEKNCKIYSFLDLDEQSAAKWVVDRVSIQGAHINIATARRLVDYIGVDQVQLDSEIDKLISYNSDISVESIDLLVSRRPQEIIFTILSHIFNQNKLESISLIRELEATHSDPHYFTSMLIWQLHVLVAVSSNGSVSDNQIAKDIKISPYVVKKSRVLVSNITRSQCLRMVDIIVDLELSLKYSSTPPWALIKQSILEIGSL